MSTNVNIRLSFNLPLIVSGSFEPLNIGSLWMIVGDSQTEGRTSGVCDNPMGAFEIIFDTTYPTSGSTVVLNGSGGRNLEDTISWYLSNENRTNRTWVHFQESGDQNAAGQTTSAIFAETFEDACRTIKLESPNAIISTETAFSFGRDAEANRNWDLYNVAMRQKIAILSADGINVYLAETDRHIKGIQDIITATGVWFTSAESNAYHYKNVGNLMVALSMFDALGYDVNELDMSGIPTNEISNEWKQFCLDVINS